MKKRMGLIGILAVVFVVPFTYNSCGNPARFSETGLKYQSTTTVGNPMTAAPKVLAGICNLIPRCHTQVSISQCELGILATGGFESTLGLPSASFKTFKDIIAAENSGSISGTAEEAQACGSEIANLSCASPEVQSAYDPSQTNPFVAAPAVVPTSACGNIYSLSSSFQAVTPDPGGLGAGVGGFSRNHWLESIGKMLSPFGGGWNSVGDNSLRAYDPLNDNWEYLWPDGHANGGIQNRSGHASFYIPRIDEVWIWGGSSLEGYASLTGDPTAQALRSGRFSVSQRKWVKTSTTDGGAFTDVVSGNVPFPAAESAMAWSHDLDMGLLFGGSTQGNPADGMLVFEPNPQGPQPYKVTSFTGPRPPAREQVSNNMVAVGPDFYLIGGSAGSGVFVRDFWKFDGVKREWARLTDPPAVGYQSPITYDSELQLIIAWVNDRLFAYRIGTGEWLDITPTGLPCVFNQMAVYSPTAKVHIFEGGNRCGDGSSTYMTSTVKVNVGAAK
jgi:hypothetical protein